MYWSHLQAPKYFRGVLSCKSMNFLLDHNNMIRLFYDRVFSVET